jgi:hypothetical protein
MRSPFLAFTFSAGVLLGFSAGESVAQPTQSYGDPEHYLSAPRPGPDMRDALRNLGAPPASGPVMPEASVGSGRELSRREREELLAPSTREAPPSPSWGSNRDRN